MRIFMVENFVSKEFNIESDDGVSDVVEFANTHCGKAINEFVKTNNILYRGLNGVDDHAYVVPTEDKRSSLGNISKGKTGASFNKWLKDNGHVPRDTNVAFTTSGKPEDYRGVNVDQWFYFVPIGDYHYSYVDMNDATDYNHSGLVQRSLGQIRSIEESIHALEGEINIYNAEVRSYIRKHDLNNNTMSLLKKFSKRVDTVNNKLQKLIMDVSMLFQDGIFQNENVKTLEDKVLDVSKVVFKDYESIISDIQIDMITLENDSEEHTTLQFLQEILESIHSEVDLLEMVNEFSENVIKLMHSFITDFIGEGFNKKEVAVSCKSYLAIPYDDTGKEIIQHLKSL